MTDTSSKTPRPPAPSPDTETATPPSAMQANEKLIGRAIIGSGAPKRG